MLSDNVDTLADARLVPYSTIESVEAGTPSLLAAGIDAISVSPDSFLSVKRTVAEAEKKYKKKRA